MAALSHEEAQARLTGHKAGERMARDFKKYLQTSVMPTIVMMRKAGAPPGAVACEFADMWRRMADEFETLRGTDVPE